MKSLNLPKKILIAPDKFKGTLSAPEAARAMKRGVDKYCNESGIQTEAFLRPLADGGEGSHSTLLEIDNRLEEVFMQLTSASGTLISAPHLIRKSEDAHCYLETALVMGLELPGSKDINIQDRLTDGIGEWIKRMIDVNSSCEKISLHLFLGGSATSDGGFGLARAIGFRFISESGEEIVQFRGTDQLAKIELPELNSSLPEVHVNIYTDVQNPLTGQTGAARLFAPQKGATPEEVDLLEKWLSKMESCLKEASGIHDKDFPGAGAAGGLALPLLYWPAVKIELKSGIDFFLNSARIPELLKNNTFELIMSGEGCTDRGTLTGKAVAGIFNTAEELSNARFAVFSGIIKDEDELKKAGYNYLFGTTQFCPPTDDLKRDAADRLTETVYQGLRQMYA